MLGNEAVADYIANAKAEFKPIVERLATIVSHASEHLDMAIKWKQLTFALQGDFHHWICAIATTNKGVTLNFHFGGLLNDPEKSIESRHRPLLAAAGISKHGRC